jgi:DNA-binding CsgD family transcriptional regulator
MKPLNSNSLTQYDVQQVFQFLQELNSVISLPDFPARLISILRLIIESDFTLIAGTDPDLVGRVDDNSNNQGDDRTLASVLVANDFHLLSKTKVSLPYFLQNPVTMHYLSTGDGSAHKISDFLNEPDMCQRDALYGDFLQPLGMLDQMSLVITDQKRSNQRYTNLAGDFINNLVIKTTPSSVYLKEALADLVIIIHRDRRNFSERDRDILNFLSPHILQAYKNSQLISQIKQECEQLHQVLDNTNTIGTDRNGFKKLVTGPAEELIRKYFPVSTYGKDNLPETIRNWLQKKIANWSSDADLSAPIPPLRVIQGKHLLVIRLSVDAANDQYLLTLEEQAPLELSFSLLQELGLSKRESEILHWIFHDKSNQQISEILNLSNRTVQKHCENIYDRLGVNSRAAAITQVLQKLGIAMFV